MGENKGRIAKRSSKRSSNRLSTGGSWTKVISALNPEPEHVYTPVFKDVMPDMIRDNPRVIDLGSDTTCGSKGVAYAIVAMEMGRRVDKFMGDLNDPMIRQQRHEEALHQARARAQQGTSRSSITNLVVDQIQHRYPETFKIYMNRINNESFI
jgi:hypothetical protein